MAAVPCNHFYRILEVYEAGDRSEHWFSATVVNKKDSSYRKPGALMLISPLGKSFGLVSGGCLEADIVRRARHVHHSGKADYVVYDSTEEGNIAAELGLGCNGSVGVLVQKLTRDHEALMLMLLQQLRQGRQLRLLQCYESPNEDDLAHITLLDEYQNVVCTTDATIPLPQLPPAGNHPHLLIADDSRIWALSTHRPPPSLWVIGGGLDAQPLVKMAALLGWRVTVVDHRTSYARPTDFPAAERIIRKNANDFPDGIDADAVVIMSHNLSIDAAWLKRLADTPPIPYLGILGPVSRKQEVFELAGIDLQSAFARAVHGPMGLDLGGDLPESVALSIISQCHAVLSGKHAYLNTSLDSGALHC